GVEAWLIRFYPGGVPAAPPHWKDDNGYTAIDRALYHLQFLNSPLNRRKIRYIVSAIEKVRVKCGGEMKVRDLLDRMHYTSRREAREVIGEAHLEVVPSPDLRAALYDIYDRRFDFDRDGGISLPVATGLVGAVEIEPGLGAELDTRRRGRGRGRGGGNGGGTHGIGGGTGGGTLGNRGRQGMNNTLRGGVESRRTRHGGRSRGQSRGRG
ncbi:hypothetical protein HDU76_011976, partial [Blyttiomyces sp. JEL0837]